MNRQIRRLFLVILAMFAVLGAAATNVQFVNASALNADDRNARTILQAAELDRGPIIVDGQAVASSTKDANSARYQRVYSDGPLYAPVTGYFASVFNQATGLEKAAEQVLEGNSQALFVQRLRNLFTGQGRVGGGVVLTLDPDLQRVAAEQLGNRRGAVVVLDAQTSAVLALFSSPSFDPNTLAQFDSSAANAAFNELNQDQTQPLVNRAIAGDLYAPGSAFKILTTIALLESGVATPDTPMDSPVEMTLPGTSTTLSNIESSTCGTGTPTLTEAFARSCNTTFALASEDLTHQELADVADRFGFGQELSIPLDVTPSVFPEQTDPATLALSSIGQYDVRVTPLQMAMVAQAIADDGVLMTPYLIDQVVDADLQVQSTTEPSALATPISGSTASQLTSMMVDVTSQPYGTGTSMAIDGTTVAAKTGTAEVGTSGRANAWAVGFAPADNPRLAFAVVVEGDDEQPVPHGGTVAGPIARAVLEAGLQ